VTALAGRLLAGILTLLLVLALASWLILTVAARDFSDELTQQLNGSIAMYVVQEQLLIRDGRANTVEMQRLARQAMVINPMAEVYLLDASGRVIGWRPDRPIVASSIDLAPLRQFLRGANEGPVYAIDPRQPTVRRVFSAAEVRHQGRLEGYVYVVLGGSRAAGLRATLASSYILRAALFTVLVLLLLAALAAWALTVGLTRPIAVLHGRVLALGEQLGADGIASERRKPGDLAAVREVFESLSCKLRAHVDALNQADRLRREMITNISHDLRTPLTAMRGYLDSIELQSDRLPGERRREYLAIALRHCDRLNRLVDQMFSLARLDVAAVRLRPEPVSLTELAQDIVSKFQLSADAAQVRLQLEVDPHAAPVAADISMLETVLENLLDNALRHTPAGAEIVVAVANCRAGVRTQVRDRGAGIESADLQRITKRFEIGSRGRTGLGLAIVSRVLELHGSKLELLSAPGRGTTAAFTLPALPIAAKPTSQSELQRRDEFVTG
jgi:two-component system OmpR family sensor kinase